jgi:hypothetical protein
MIHILQNSAVFYVKNAIFRRFFGENISRIITSVPKGQSYNWFVLTSFQACLCIREPYL